MLSQRTRRLIVLLILTAVAIALAALFLILQRRQEQMFEQIGTRTRMLEDEKEHFPDDRFIVIAPRWDV